METPSENKENTTRGCLTLNDKIYPVYDGHNTVGRNPDALINIKNLNVSKHHAVITVIDQELHYISDFKSSNGTVLDSKKLTPLRLYKLNNGSSIKFGDVFCTYKKHEGEKNIPNNVDETQQFSENFYATATQEVDLPNIPDGINFNEMPTQLFAEKELSINEMPTQVHHFPGFDDESSNDSIDFITMQKSTESQIFKCDKNLNSLIDSDEEAETSGKNPTQTSSNSSQIRPVTINSNKIVDSETEDEVASQICRVRKARKNVIDSDSDAEEYLNTSDQKSKYHISDDSETDIESDINKEDLNETDIVPESEIEEEREENSMASFRLELNESADCPNEGSFKKSKISKKDEDKVVPQDHLHCQALTQTQNDPHRNEELILENDPKEGNLNVPETGEENLQRNEETDLIVSKPRTEAAVQKDEEKQSSQKESKEEEEAPKADEKVAASAVIPDNNSDTTSSLPLPEGEERNEDVFNQPTQQFNFDFINDVKIADRDQNEDQESKDKDAKDTSSLTAEEILKHDQNEDNEKEGENIKETTSLQSEEILDQSASKDVEDEKGPNEMKNELILENDPKEGNLNVPETAEENLQSNEETDLMVSKATTEAVVTKDDEEQSSHKESKEEGEAPEPDEKVAASAVIPDNDSNTTSSLPLPEGKERNEDVFDQPTQQFNFDFINDAKIVHRDQNEDQESKFEDAKDTSSLIAEEILNHDQNEDKEKEGESIKETSSLQTEEILDQSASKDVEDEKGSNEMKNEETTKKEDDIFLLPTQTLDYFGSPKEFNAKRTSSQGEDDIFLQSTQVIPTSDSVTPTNKKGIEEDIFLHPTQALENLLGDEDRPLQIEHSSDDKNESLETTQTLESLLDDDFTKNTDLTSRSSLPEEDDEDLLLPPTQGMELLHGDDKITEMEKSLSSKDEEADDLFLPPTQALENLLSDAGPSCKNDDVFLPPNPFKDPSPSKKFGHKPPKEDDDSFILPPTQAMEILHEDGTHFNKVEDQLHDIFASQNLLCTQQLVDVLNTSRGDDIIDDSIVQEDIRRGLSLRKSVPLSEESVKEILAGDEDHEDVELLTVNRSRSNVKTYSTKKEETEEKKQIQEEKEAGSSKSSIVDNLDDGENKSNRGATSTRKGRKKQELEVREGTTEEKIAVDKTVNETGKRGRKLRRNLIAFDDEDKPEGKEASDLKGKKQNKAGSKKDRESSVGSSGSEVGTRKGRNRRQMDNDDSKSGKNEDKGQKKGSTIELKKQESQESNEGKRRRGRSIKSTSSDDRESNTDNSQNSSQNSSNDGKSRKERKKQIDEDKKVDSGKTENDKIQDLEKSGENRRRGRSKNQSIAKHQELSVGDGKGTSQTTNDNEENKRRIKEKQIMDEVEVDQDGDKKSAVPDRRGKSKQSATAISNRESNAASTKNSSQNSNVGANVRRGRSKQKVDGDQEEEQDKKEESQSSVESKGRGKSKQGETKNRESRVESSKDGSQNSSNYGSNRRSRRQQKIDEEETKKDEAADVKKQEIDNNEEKRRLGRRKQIASESDEHTNIEPNEQENKTRGRKKQTETEKTDDRRKSREETPEPSTSKTKKANKRKQDGDEPPETPTKKKPENADIKKQDGPVTPRKRGLKIPSNDSEDDFVTKIPKIETPTKTRQSARKKKEASESSEEVITISSASSEKSIISISSTPSVGSAKKPRRLSANSRRQKREEDEEGGKKQKTTRKASVAATATPVLATPERSRRVLKPKVVFTMMDNPELESLIRTLGGSIVDTVDTCTVLVTESVKRSQKLLCAVGQGKPICSPQWLHACKKAFSFVDPWGYILVDKEAEKKWNFSLRESLKRSSASKLLENYTFQVMVNNAADVLKGAIESSGGKCVNKSLAKCTTDHLIIVSTANNKAKYSKIVQQNKKIKVVGTEAIFDGTLRQQFRFDDFLLS